MSQEGKRELGSQKERGELVGLPSLTSRGRESVAFALEGETVSIAKDEQHAVQLVPLSGRPFRRQPGRFKGQIHMSEDFDAPLEDFKEYME